MIANKKYVDDQNTAGHPTYSGGESHTDGSGLIIKMGTKSVSANASATVTFGDAFSNALISVVTSIEWSSASGSKSGTMYVTAKSTSAITLFNSEDTTVTAHWIAIGH